MHTYIIRCSQEPVEDVEVRKSESIEIISLVDLRQSRILEITALVNSAVNDIKPLHTLSEIILGIIQKGQETLLVGVSDLTLSPRFDLMWSYS